MKKYIVFFLVFCMNSLIFSAKLTFNDGSILEGKIKSITEDKIVLEYDFGEVVRFRHQIKDITNLSQDELELLKESAFFTEKTPSPELSEGRLEHHSSNASNLTQNAYDSLIYLKEKIQAKYEEEKQLLKKSFESERQFLEHNLELLAQKHALLKEKIKEQKKINQSLQIEMNESKGLNNKYGTDILQLKNEISFLNEARLKSEVKTTEKIQKAIQRNKKLLDKEKQTIIDSYEDQITEIEAQLSQTNIKALKLAKENSDLEARLANMEKLSNQNGTTLKALEKQYEAEQINHRLEIETINKQHQQDKISLEKLLAAGSESIVQLENKIKMLMEEKEFFNDEINQLKMQINDHQKEIQFLLSDNQNLKTINLNLTKDKQALIDQIEQEKNNMLKTLVDSVLIQGDEKTLSELKKQAQKALEKAKQKGIKESYRGRTALMQLFQQDLSAVNQKLEETQSQLKQLENHNVSLQSNIQKKELQLNEIFRQKQLAEQEAMRFQKEKEEIRSEVSKIIEQIRKESKQKLEQEKHELKKHVTETIKTMEKEPSPLMTDTTFEPVTTKEITSDANMDFLTEKPQNNMKNISTQTTPQTTQPSSKQNGAQNQPKLEVGVISQVEKEFSRVFIDTKENLKDEDIVYVYTPKGEVQLKIIKVYETLNGAIAESTEKDTIKNIKIKDSVYIK